MSSLEISQISIITCQSASDELVDAMKHLIPQLSQSSLPPSLAELEEIVASPASTLFLAVYKNKIVGCLTLVTFRIPTGVRARIEDVVVDETLRGNCIAEKLSAAALRHAQNAGARNVDLTSRPAREAANRLYVRMGFRLRESNVYRYRF